MVLISGMTPMQHYPTSYGMQELARWWREHHPHQDKHPHDKNQSKNHQKQEKASPTK